MRTDQGRRKKSADAGRRGENNEHEHDEMSGNFRLTSRTCVYVLCLSTASGGLLEGDGLLLA